MAVRTAEAIWQGNLRDGNGTMKVESGVFEGAYTFRTRFEDEPGTNPEELIGAAHAGCFSMFLASVLSNDGFPPKKIQTTASVHLGRDDSGPLITLIELSCQAEVPGVGKELFDEKVDIAKKNCPVSRALAATEMKVQATLINGG